MGRERFRGRSGEEQETVTVYDTTIDNIYLSTIDG